MSRWLRSWKGEELVVVDYRERLALVNLWLRGYYDKEILISHALIRTHLLWALKVGTMILYSSCEYVLKVVKSNIKVNIPIYILMFAEISSSTWP